MAGCPAVFQLEAIVEVFQEQCNQRVEATAHIKKRYVNQIAELEQKLISICKALGQPADEVRRLG